MRAQVDLLLVGVERAAGEQVDAPAVVTREREILGRDGGLRQPGRIGGAAARGAPLLVAGAEERAQRLGQRGRRLPARSR